MARIHVLFGHVIQGAPIVRLIEELPTDDKHRPLTKVTVSHCGELILKVKSIKKPCFNFKYIFNKVLIRYDLKKKLEKKRKTSESSYTSSSSSDSSSESVKSGSKSKKKKKKSKTTNGGKKSDKK